MIRKLRMSSAIITFLLGTNTKSGRERIENIYEARSGFVKQKHATELKTQNTHSVLKISSLEAPLLSIHYVESKLASFVGWLFG